MDVLWAGDTLKRLAAISPDKDWFSRQSLYAKDGLDLAHPSADGHRLLAELVGYYLKQHVLRPLEASTVQQLTLPALPLEARAVQEAGQAEAKWALSERQEKQEQCYEPASALPVIRNSGWRLEDTGRHKGVQKLGFLSEQKGDRLVLGPMWNSQAAAGSRSAAVASAANSSTAGCVMLEICLGYLLSARSPDSRGALRIDCTGCVCGRHWSHSRYLELDPTRSARFGAWVDNPFPLIQTSTSRTSILRYRSANVSITETTCWRAVQQPRATCQVELVNAGAPNHLVSQVQVNSLTVELQEQSHTLGELAPLYRSVGSARSFAITAGTCSRATLATECAKINVTYAKPGAIAMQWSTAHRFCAAIGVY